MDHHHRHQYHRWSSRDSGPGEMKDGDNQELVMRRSSQMSTLSRRESGTREINIEIAKIRIKSGEKKKLEHIFMMKGRRGFAFLPLKETHSSEAGT